jgi:hypothetical protein
LEVARTIGADSRLRNGEKNGSGIGGRAEAKELLVREAGTEMREEGTTKENVFREFRARDYAQ